MFLGVQKNVREFTFTLPSELPSLEGNCRGQNSLDWDVPYIIGNFFEIYMSEMGSHDSFGHLKHKLWPKEGPGVKLTIWFPTIKSWESPQFPSLQVVCDIPLERSRWVLQLCFRLHLNRRSADKIMGPQSCKNPNLGNFRTPTWESWDKMSFGCEPRGEAHNIL